MGGRIKSRFQRWRRLQCKWPKKSPLSSATRTSVHEQGQGQQGQGQQRRLSMKRRFTIKKQNRLCDGSLKCPVCVLEILVQTTQRHASLKFHVHAILKCLTSL